MSVLVCGAGTAVGSEIALCLLQCENVNVTLYDNQTLTEADILTNSLFTLCHSEDVGQNRGSLLCRLLKQRWGFCSVSCLNEFAYTKIEDYDCVILSGNSIHDAVTMNGRCRSCSPQVPLIIAEFLRGLGWIFVDFGAEFESHLLEDEREEIFICDISKGPNGTVTCGVDHNLNCGDKVYIQDVVGMVELNGRELMISESLTPNTFAIGDTSAFSSYISGGRMTLTPPVHKIKNKPFLDCLNVLPQENPRSYIEMKRLYEFEDGGGGSQLSNHTIKSSSGYGDISVPFVAYIAGTAVSYAMTAVTKLGDVPAQWCFISLDDVGKIDVDAYAEGMQRLRRLRAVCVGCSGQGVALLRTLAMLNAFTEVPGKLSIIDSSLIKPNNSSFGCSSRRMKKAHVLKDHLQKMKNNINVESRMSNASPASRLNTDYELVLSGSNNQECRRYLDKYTIDNLTPWVDLGGSGYSGYVQVTIPHQTEHHGAIRGITGLPDDPHCVVKSFPSCVRHCTRWAVGKFQSLFFQDPQSFNKFWQKQAAEPENLHSLIQKGESIRGPAWWGSLLELCLSRSWELCVGLARVKFEKYFRWKALHLLHYFPSDTRRSDGLFFWQPPRRKPRPLTFCIDDSTHVSFVMYTAELMARMVGVEPEHSTERFRDILSRTTLPEFIINNNKKIETEEGENSRNKEEPVESPDNDVYVDLTSVLKKYLQPDTPLPRLYLNAFYLDELDDVDVGWLTAATNLRAHMYGLPSSDTRHLLKLAKGRVICEPAMALRTAGLAALEVVKLACKVDTEKQKNWWVSRNVTPLSASPLPPQKTSLSEDITFSIWDRWHYFPRRNNTLDDLLNWVKEKCGLAASSVVEDTKIVYMPFLPGHMKRRKHKLPKLLGNKKGILNVIVDRPDGSEQMTPPLHYTFMEAATSS